VELLCRTCGQIDQGYPEDRRRDYLSATDKRDVGFEVGDHPHPPIKALPKYNLPDTAFRFFWHHIAEIVMSLCLEGYSAS
jgi:hypothetical protein